MSEAAALVLERELDARLSGLGSVVVAFSGGVDSAYLAVRAHAVLGPRALAVTADSASLADVQRQAARALAARFGFAHRVIETRELEDEAYLRNGPDRCYHCKAELFRELLPLAAREGFARVAYGLIADDLSDFRPGHRAAREAGVVAPLADAGFSKEAVRGRSRALGLPTWDQPASPCLSSRIPYGTRVTPEALRQVERAEASLRALGFAELRVRHLGPTARVELGAAERARLADPALAERAREAVRGAGFRDAVIDREGYRRGRLNEALRVIPPARV
jgi:uncharacterized protein